jgi:hypothetical protein
MMNEGCKMYWNLPEYIRVFIVRENSRGMVVVILTQRGYTNIQVGLICDWLEGL